MEKKAFRHFSMRAALLLALIFAFAGAQTTRAENTMYVIAEEIGGTISISQRDENNNSSSFTANKIRLTFYYGERPSGYTEGSTVWSQRTASIGGSCIFDVPTSADWPAWYVSVSEVDAARRQEAVVEVQLDPSFAAAKPTSTAYWFQYMENLRALNLNDLDVSKLTNAKYMFTGCTNLKNIYCESNWDRSKLTTSSNMFRYCTSLPGYNVHYVDKAKAKPQPDGYFTAIGLNYKTAGRYYEINDEQDLIDLGNYTNATTANTCEGMTFKLTRDLDFSSRTTDDCQTIDGEGNFIPLKHFKGTFDGQGHTITGLRFNGNMIALTGLFARTYYPAVIQNVTVVSPTFNSGEVGGIVGTAQGGTISNCTVVGGTLNSTNNYAGGIISYMKLSEGDGIISDCTVVNTSISGGSTRGIIAGIRNNNNYTFTISNCNYHNPSDLPVCGGSNGYTDGGGNQQVYQARLADGLTAIGATYSYGQDYYYASGATVTLAADREGYVFLGYTATGVTLSGSATSFTMPASDVTIGAEWADPADFSVNAAGTEYTIHTATGWDVFCDCLDDNDTWNRFSGKTVRLGDDITVTRMAGGQYHDFCGTFDGQGNTLTVNISSDDITDGSTQYVAPFRYVSNTKADPSDEADSPATIRNLHVTGTITTDKQFTGGLIGGCWGTVIVENCRVSTAITSTISGDGTHGGIVGIQQNGSLTITGCLFDGSLLGATTYAVGGFLGYRRSGAEIRNSLFAPAEVTVLNTSGATFARNKVDTYNSYYTYYLCDGTNYAPYDPADADHPDKYNNGHATRTVTAAADVTIEAVALTGTPTQYTVSGITAYSGGGLQRGQTLYYGSGDQLSLTLSNSATGAPEGYQYGYSASAGTLDGTTLTMPDADVTITVSTDHLASTGQAVPVGYTDADGKSHDASAVALDGTESDLGAYSQETWYFVGIDISHTGEIDCCGNVNIILCDGKTMTANHSNSNGAIWGANGSTIAIYGQTAGTGTLNINSTDCRGITTNGDVVINGGTVNAILTGTKYHGDNAIQAIGSVIINGGNVTANATGGNNGIYGSGNVEINGGNVTATGTYGSGINAHNGDGTITLGWTKPTDRITASSYRGTVKVADGKMLTDGSGSILTGTLTANDIAGKTLYPYIENIAPTASEVDGNYWTTFYCGHTGYKIKDEENACAYTATVANSTITLHKLGKVIPAGTAVIVVGADSEISMTASTDAAEYPVSNNLRGVDVRTATADIKSMLGDGTFYVLSKKGDAFGFYQYTGAYIPARKAYLLLSGTEARSLTMVFEDETTEISDALRLNDKGQMTNDNFYDLQGRKIEKPTKGLYIVNGRKVVVK